MVNLVILFLLFLAYVVAALVGPSSEFTLFIIFAALAVALLRRWRAATNEEERWRHLNARIQGVELNQQQLRKTFQELMTAGQHVPAPAHAEERKAEAPVTPKPAEHPKVEPAIQKPVLPIEKPAEVAAKPAPVAAPQPAPAAFPAPDRPKPVAVPVAPPVAARTTTPQPAAPLRAASTSAPHAAQHTPVSPPPRKTSFDIEEMLGTNWMAKLGITLLVFGLAFLLAHEWDQIGPLGKVLIGYLSAGVLLAGGIRLDSSERYRNLSYAGIGGGWATAFFTTYAMHFLQGSKVLDSQFIDLVLMLAVASAMVAHTLRYKSQTVTGLAFLLGFSTIAIGHNDTVYSLSAGAILAISLVTLVQRYNWFELEVMGILASYINHYYWLRRVIEPMHGHNVMFPEFGASIAILLFYWAVFRGSYVLRKITDPAQEKVSSLAAVLNTSLLLAVMRYQSVHKEWAFWALLALGAIELTLAQLPTTKKRRTAFVILSTLGVLMLVSAWPFRYSGSSLSVLWLMDAEALLLAGVLAREVLFRRFALLASVLAAGHILATRFGDASSDRRGAIIFAFAAVLFYADSLWIPRRWAQLISTKFERDSFRALSYLAMVMAGCAVWMGTPQAWIAPGWAFVATALAFIGWRFGLYDLTLESYPLLFAAFFRTLAYNYDVVTHPASHFNLRVLTVCVVAAAFYACGAFGALRRAAGSVLTRAVHSWAALVLLVALSWYEYPNSWLAAIWMLFALALAAVVRYLDLSEFWWQSVMIATGVFVRVLAVNLFDTSLYNGHSLRLITVGLVVGAYYALAAITSKISAAQRGARASAWVYTWIAGGLAMTLAWYELHNPNSVAVAWTLFGLLLFELGMNMPTVNFRVQGYTALLASFARVLIANMNAVTEPGHVSQRLITVLPLVAAFFYMYVRVEEGDEKSLERDRTFRAGSLLSYFGTATLALLLYFEVAAEAVIVSWAALTLLLMAIAWSTNRRTFLHHGVLLSLFVAGRGLMFNLYDAAGAGSTFYHGRWFTVGASAALMFVSLPFAFKLRDRSGEGRNWLARVMDAYPEQVLFFAPLTLITFLLERQVSSGTLTIAWGIESVVVFMFALMVGERSFRLAGLGWLLVCVGKILLVDVWRLEARDRYLTFILLGALLLGVSFLYSRYREIIRQYI